MKKHCFFLFAILISYPGFTQNVGIGTNAPDVSAQLDVSSTTKGILIPRMTMVQRDAIAAPATGLLIFQSDNTPGFYFYNGSVWALISGSGAAMSWNLMGNTGTNPGTNFIGTIDEQPLLFRVNNLQAGMLHHQNSNTAFGLSALGLNTSGRWNTAIGDSAGFNNGSGNLNSFFGNMAGFSNTVGAGNAFFGSQAGYSNSTAGYNTAIGNESMYWNTSGLYNTALGWRSLRYMQTGTQNTAIGVGAIEFPTNSNQNVAVGRAALVAAEGTYNTAVGYFASGSTNFDVDNTYTVNKTTTLGAYAGYNNIGDENTFIGYYSGVGISTDSLRGIENVAVGAYTLMANTTGKSNIVLGFRALQNNTSGNNNVAVGVRSLENNTTAGNLTAVGYQSLQNNSIGLYNTGIGYAALQANTSGTHNTSIGYISMTRNTTGSFNTSQGAFSLYTNQVGLRNTAIGTSALYYNNANDNTAIGYESLNRNTSGAYNTTIGVKALFTNTIGSNNTAIGYGADVTVNNLTNTTAVGYLAKVNASNTVQIGNSAVTDVYFGDGTTTVLHGASVTPSDARFKYNIKNNVPGLDFITQLRPVTYYLDLKKLADFTKTGIISNSNVHNVAYTGQKQLHTGFLAQDVEIIAKELGYQFDGIHQPVNNRDHYSLTYSRFVVPLVKAVQEQQVIIEKLIKQVERSEIPAIVGKQQIIIENLKKQVERSEFPAIVGKQQKIIEELKMQVERSEIPAIVGKQQTMIREQRITNQKQQQIIEQQKIQIEKLMELMKEMDRRIEALTK